MICSIGFYVVYPTAYEVPYNAQDQTSPWTIFDVNILHSGKSLDAERCVNGKLRRRDRSNTQFELIVPPLLWKALYLEVLPGGVSSYILCGSIRTCVKTLVDPYI